MLTLLAVCLVAVSSAADTDLPPFSFDDIFDYNSFTNFFNGQWINGTNRFIYQDSNTGDVQLFDADSRTQSVLLSNSVLNSLQATNFFVSADLKYFLLAYNVQPVSEKHFSAIRPAGAAIAVYVNANQQVWSLSWTAQYKIYNVTSQALIDFPQGPLSNTELRYAGWSPTGSSLVFVTGNNLYYQASPTSSPVQVTTSGDEIWVYNGIPDWMYEADVLNDVNTVYWSPTSRYIVYAELNDTEVPLQSWPKYGSYGVDDTFYSTTVQVPFPKAGYIVNGQPGPNTKVTLYVVDTTTWTTKIIPPVDSLVGRDHYYLYVSWRDDEHVMVTWANRVQNESWTAIYDVLDTTLVPNENYHQVVTGGWIDSPYEVIRYKQGDRVIGNSIQDDPPYPIVTKLYMVDVIYKEGTAINYGSAPPMSEPGPKPYFIDNGASYLKIMPRFVSTSSGSWRHVAKITSPVNGSGSVTFITNGEVETSYIVGYDAAEQLVYYIGTNGDPTERHLSVMSINGGENSTCLTCRVSDGCKYVTANFATTYRYYILGCLGPDVPYFTLYERSSNGSDDFAVRIMENNNGLRTKVASRAMPTRQYINIPIAGGNYTGRAQVFLPQGYVKGEKYPVLFHTYAGPGSQIVLKTFAIGGPVLNWLMYLMSTYQIVVVAVDGRGTRGAGERFKQEMYRKLSVVEVQDQIEAAEYFRNVEYVNNSLPMAMFGWSYGGTVAAQVMGNPSKAFTCGLSVAPQTKQGYYDTAYSERYLGLATPNDNAAGYEATNVMNGVENFRNKTFFIAAGTADQIVHTLNEAHLMRALSDAGILFRQNFYVDENHGIRTPSQLKHLFRTMTQFLLEDCWPDMQLPQQVTPHPTLRPSGSCETSHSSLVLMLVSFLLTIVYVDF